jgi:hypothetical protein
MITENRPGDFQQLWVADGTLRGIKILEILDNEEVAYNITHEIIDNVIYFSTARGSKLWRTDGTECGTFSLPMNVTDISPIELLGSNLIFGGYSPLYGKEIFRYNVTDAPSSPCGPATAGRAAKTEQDAIAFASEEDLIASAPNPFVNDIKIKISSRIAENARVSIFTSTGIAIELWEQLPCNTTHYIGQAWPSGLYIMNVELEGKIISKKMIKE